MSLKFEWDEKANRGKFKSEHSFQEVCDVPEIEIFAFKVKDYKTILIGQRVELFDKITNSSYEVYIVQRGDGTFWSYDEDRIEKHLNLGSFNPHDLQEYESCCKINTDD